MHLHYTPCILVAMKDAKIIAIVGMPGSGKGTVSSELEKQGYPVIHFGNMVYEEVERRGLDIIKAETIVRHDMRRLEGPAVLAKRVSSKVDELLATDEKVIVLDGLYTWTEYKYLAAKYGEQLIVVAVVAPKRTRWKRASERKDNRRKYTIENVIAREIDEIENMEKGGPIAYADWYINNSGSMKEFLVKIKTTCKKLGVDIT